MQSDKSNIKVRHVVRAPGAKRTVRIVPVFTNMGIVEGKAHYAYAKHRHEQYEVILVDRGTYRCHLNDVWLTLRPNEIVVVKPGDWHADVCERALRYFGIGFHFDPEWHEGESPFLFDKDVSPEQQCLKLERPLISRILKGLQQEALRGVLLADGQGVALGCHLGTVSESFR